MGGPAAGVLGGYWGRRKTFLFLSCSSVLLEESPRTMMCEGSKFDFFFFLFLSGNAMQDRAERTVWVTRQSVRLR